MEKYKRIDTRLDAKALLTLLLFCALGIFLFVYLDETQAYSYYYREQQQLFLNDSTYIGGLMSQIGGVGVMIGQYLVQFFVTPKTGALASALISVLTGVFLWMSVKKISSSCCLTPLLMLPSFFYNLYLADHYVHYEGLVALLFMAVCLWLHTVFARWHYALRVAASSVLALLLYVGFGPVAVLYGLCVVLYDAFKGSAKVWLNLLPLALVLLTGLLAVNRGLLVDLSTAYWMQGYVEYYFHPGTFYSIAWVSVPVLMLLFRILEVCTLPKVVEFVCATVCAAALPFAYMQLNGSHQDQSMYKMERVAYHANHEDWDNVIAEAQSETGNYIFLNYLNLAYSKKGVLLDKFLTIPQAGAQSMVVANSQNAEVSMMLALLYYHAGVVGLSQVHAYSSNMAVTYGSPEMNKLMTKIYLINGQYKVAEKHIKMLEKTRNYAEWATGMRQFLYNDQALEADPELGAKRRDLPQHDGFTALYGAINDMLSIVEANPSEKNAAEYAIGMLLLDKNFDGIRIFVERYFGKLTTWPVCLQEAIVAGSEKDMDYCREHGVSEEIIQRFAQFRQETLQLRHNGGNLQQLAKNWGNTYWFYMLKTGQK